MICRSAPYTSRICSWEILAAGPTTRSLFISLMGISTTSNRCCLNTLKRITPIAEYATSKKPFSVLYADYKYLVSFSIHLLGCEGERSEKNHLKFRSILLSG